jgi:hypothetical protein
VCAIAGLIAAFWTPRFLRPTRSPEEPSKKSQSGKSLQSQPRARWGLSNGEDVKPADEPAAENEAPLTPTQPRPLNRAARAPHDSSFPSFPLQPAAESQGAAPVREVKPVSAEAVIAIPQPNRPPPVPADSATPSQSLPKPAGDDDEDEQIKDYANHTIPCETSSEDPSVQLNSCPSSDSYEVPLPSRDNNVHLPTGQSPAAGGSPYGMHERPGSGSLIDQVTDDPSAIDSHNTPQPHQLIHDN